MHLNDWAIYHILTPSSFQPCYKLPLHVMSRTEECWLLTPSLLVLPFRHCIMSKSPCQSHLGRAIISESHYSSLLDNVPCQCNLARASLCLISISCQQLGNVNNEHGWINIAERLKLTIWPCELLYMSMSQSDWCYHCRDTLLPLLSSPLCVESV